MEIKYNFGISVLMIGMGVATGYVAFAIVDASLMAAGVYFVIGVLIAAALWVISEFQSNVVQKWMAQSKLGKLSMEDKFPSLLDQRTVLIKIANG